MEATHIAQIYLNGSQVLEMEVMSIPTSSESCKVFSRVEQGEIYSTHGMVYITEKKIEDKEVTIFDLSYDILFVQSVMEHVHCVDGNYWMKGLCLPLGADIEVRICVPDIIELCDDEERMFDYFGITLYDKEKEER